MDFDKVAEIVESIIFVAGDGIKVEDIMIKLELQKSEIDAVLHTLKSKYSGDSGVLLQTYADKVQFASNPKYADEIASVLNPVREKALSRACMEVAAIVAYKQPCTKLEVELIRGVNSDYAIQTLLKQNMIAAVGRKDVVGKPLLFGTTEEFLKKFMLNSISDLPNQDQLLERISLISQPKEQKEERLYHEFEIPEEEAAAAIEQSALEEEVPDFLKGEKDLKKID